MEWLQVFTIVAALLGVVGLQTTWVIHALERLEARVDVRFDAVDARFVQVDARFDRMDERFDRADHRLDRMDERFDRMDERFDRLDGRFDRLERDVIRDHGERISRLEARLE